MQWKSLQILTASAILAMSPVQAEESVETSAMLQPVEAFAVAFNKGQQRFPEGVFTDDAVVVDGFAPYLWKGEGGIRTWYTALLGGTEAEHRAFVALGYHLKIGKPVSARTDGDLTYLVLPAINKWKSDGKAHFESASWAITLKRTSGKWLISSHSWAINRSK